MGLMAIKQAGIPSDSVDQVTDFIDTLWTDVIQVLIENLIEMIWNLAVAIFIDLAPAWGFVLMLTCWLYIFNRKFIETR